MLILNLFYGYLGGNFWKMKSFEDSVIFDYCPSFHFLYCFHFFLRGGESILDQLVFVGRANHTRIPDSVCVIFQCVGSWFFVELLYSRMSRSHER